MANMSNEDLYSRFREAHQPVSDLNFATRRKDSTIADPDPSHGYMDVALQPFMHNMALLEAGESLARYQVRNPYDLFASSLEERLRTLMNTNSPDVQPDISKDPSTAASINWADLIREAKQDDFRQHPDGKYYFLFRSEHYIIMDKHDYGVMSILKSFLHPWPPWPHPDDVDKERLVLTMEHDKAIQFKTAHAEVGSRLDGYLTKLRERDHHLAVYRNAIKDWSRIYFGAVYDLPGESNEAPLAPPIQQCEPSRAISVDSVNSIEFDNRGDIEYGDQGDDDFVPPGGEGFLDESTENLDNTVSEASRGRSHARKCNNPTDASYYTLSSITERNGGDDDERDDNEETPTNTPTKISSPKRRRVATNYSLSTGVRTRLNQIEKQNGFSVLDPLLKKGIPWSSVTDQYNLEFGTHRSVESVRAVWDRLSLNPEPTEGVTAIRSKAEPSPNKHPESRTSKSRRKLVQQPNRNRDKQNKPHEEDIQDQDHDMIYNGDDYNKDENIH
ncbi:hypothetical protein N7526_007499 [Penicillium atrosanguineum]|nr:hypothetical protein N7526_007499 [Penicillium atrosanguineum]